jgi:hypothetical protein
MAAGVAQYVMGSSVADPHSFFGSSMIVAINGEQDTVPV